MSVTLAAMSPRVSVRPSDDPYKKYWWVILAGFGVTGAWLSLPMMESSVGSTRVNTGGAAEGMPSGEASLDGSSNPSGAPGSALDLSMDIGSRARKGDGAMMSSLYQAPDEPELPVEAGTVGAAASGGTLASALKKAASADPSGWGGQKAQKGFAQPKLGGSSTPGLGGGSAGSAASFTAGIVGSAFGSQNAQVGFAGTSGLKGNVSDLPGPKTAKAALVNAANTATKAANSLSKDGQVGGLSTLFDGRAKRGGSAIGGEGGENLGAGGVYGSLDAAPTNLKLNDPSLDKKEYKEFREQMAMMVVTTVIGGVIGGPVGTAVVSMAPMLMQMNKVNRESATTGQAQK